MTLLKASLNAEIENYVLPALIETFKSTQRNGWIMTDNLDLYWRNSMHFVHSDRPLLRSSARRTLDLPNVIVRQPGNGMFRYLLGRCEELIDQDVIGVDTLYIENVLNSSEEHDFINFFRKRGYIETTESAVLGSSWPKSWAYIRDMQIHK